MTEVLIVTGLVLLPALLLPIVVWLSDSRPPNTEEDE